MEKNPWFEGNQGMVFEEALQGGNKWKNTSIIL